MTLNRRFCRPEVGQATRRIVFALSALLLTFVDPATSRADIYRWDDATLVPGTEGIESGPDLQLDNRTLAYADLSGWNLLRSRLNSSDLTNAQLQTPTLSNADLTGAVVAGANFGYTDFTKEQLYSTASYEAKNLRGIDLERNDLSHWSFSRQDLTNANFKWATLSSTDLTGADVTGADFGSATNYGLTNEQLYSTASYSAKDLRGVHLGHGDTFGFPGPENDLAGWDFSGQDLTNAWFNGANLTNMDLTGAVVNGVNFEGASIHGFTEEQLHSTASYRLKDLRGIDMRYNDLTGWDFSGQDLTHASFAEAILTNADLSGAVVTGASFFLSTGFTKEQLYTTASYRTNDLRGIDFQANKLTGWDFRGQDLTNTLFSEAKLTNADLTGADARGAQLLDVSRAVSRNAILPDGSIAGFKLAAGERMLVRDDDGVPGSLTQWWADPRSPIPVTIQDNLTMAEGSVLQLRFESNPWDSLISFENGISVQLGGTLELTFADEVDIAAQLGRTLHIFDWTGVTPSGQFVVSSPYVWDASNLYATGDVTLRAVPEPSAAMIMLLGVMAIAACCRLHPTVATTSSLSRWSRDRNQT